MKKEGFIDGLCLVWVRLKIGNIKLDANESTLSFTNHPVGSRFSVYDINISPT